MDSFSILALYRPCRLLLDDCWDKRHAELLNCVDSDVGSICVITTRIRNIAEEEVSRGLPSP